EHARSWPATMLCSSTHDTKRSEDVRARINVLAELADDWDEHVGRWFDLARRSLTEVEGKPAPSRNDQYLLFQTLLGTWLDPMPNSLVSLHEYRDRILTYMEKAVKEAKQHTNWINPNEEYDQAVRSFVMSLLSEVRDNPFLDSFIPFARRVAFLGRFNSLAQVVLKLTAPGVPDIYQGSEIWDYSLVDPDNRRPVNFRRRSEMLASLLPMLEASQEPQDRSVADLLANAADGRIKMYV